MNHAIRKLLVVEYEGELIDLTEVRKRQAITRRKNADWIRFNQELNDQEDHEAARVFNETLQELNIFINSEDCKDMASYNLGLAS